MNQRATGRMCEWTRSDLGKCHHCIWWTKTRILSWVFFDRTQNKAETTKNKLKNCEVNNDLNNQKWTMFTVPEQKPVSVSKWHPIEFHITLYALFVLLLKHFSIICNATKEISHQWIITHLLHPKPQTIQFQCACNPNCVIALSIAKMRNNLKTKASIIKRSIITAPET